MIAAIFCICGACITTCCISSDDNPVVETQQPTIQRITERGKLLVGTTGDYRPLSYREGQDDLLQIVNNTIRQMKADGTLRSLHEKYGLVYAY